MEIKLKLCGIRRSEDVDYLNEFPPNYAGFVFAESPRKVTLNQVHELSKRLLPQIIKVGVFLNQPIESMKDFSDEISVFQLHGDEDEDYIKQLRKIIPNSCEIWKAVRVNSAEDILKADNLPADKLLLDAFTKDSYGGTGKTANWDLIASTKINKPFFAAGGITAANLPKAAEKLNPFGIDISSGIETEGIKDREKIKEITQVIRRFK